MTIGEQIDFFFTEPVRGVQGQLLSSLYLARREMQDCLIGEVLNESEVLTSGRPIRRAPSPLSW